MIADKRKKIYLSGEVGIRLDPHALALKTAFIKTKRTKAAPNAGDQS